MANMELDVFRVLAVDPGRAKCGVAVVSRDEGVLHRAVVLTAGVAAAVDLLFARYNPQLVIVGNGTGSAKVTQTIRAALPAELPLEQVDERHTSEIARKRFLLEHPAHGLGRLVPFGLRTPSIPYDDYVAIILAERRLSGPAGNPARNQNGR